VLFFVVGVRAITARRRSRRVARACAEQPVSMAVLPRAHSRLRTPRPPMQPRPIASRSTSGTPQVIGPRPIAEPYTTRAKHPRNLHLVDEGRVPRPPEPGDFPRSGYQPFGTTAGDSEGCSVQHPRASSVIRLRSCSTVVTGAKSSQVAKSWAIVISAAEPDLFGIEHQRLPARLPTSLAMGVMNCRRASFPAAGPADSMMRFGVLFPLPAQTPGPFFVVPAHFDLAGGTVFPSPPRSDSFQPVFLDWCSHAVTVPAARWQVTYRVACLVNKSTSAAKHLLTPTHFLTVAPATESDAHPLSYRP